MGSKPVVAMALSRSLHEIMFATEDLARLSEVADVVGPVTHAELVEVLPLLAEARVAITGWGSPQLDHTLLEKAPKLELVAHSAGSIRPVVTDALYDRGVKITTAAAANAVPVAESVVAMMVMMLKRLPWLMQSHGDRSVLNRVAPIRELSDLDVGLIGASRVGREVIRLLRNYAKLRVRIYDPYLSQDEARSLGVRKASLEEVCRCDLVSVHAPDLPETKQMLNARTLALLPDHAVLINTSRGSLIDESALVAEVRRRPLYVLLDVTDPEPPVAGSPITREPNIILTPHIAGAVGQARQEMGKLAIEETLRFLRGEPLQHEVTREMLPTQA